MFLTKARSKFIDLSKSFKLFYILALGAFVSVLSYVVYQDLIVTVTIIVSSVVLYIFFSLPPKTIDIKIEESGILIDKNQIMWTQCIGWSMVDLENDIEFVIQTSELSGQFYYFYLNQSDQNIRNLAKWLNQYIPYNPEISNRNRLHNVFRRFGLK